MTKSYHIEPLDERSCNTSHAPHRAKTWAVIEIEKKRLNGRGYSVRKIVARLTTKTAAEQSLVSYRVAAGLRAYSLGKRMLRYAGF